LASTTETLQLDVAAVTEFSRQRGDTAAAATWRARAATVLAQTPYPDRVRHLWRYTDPDRLMPGKPLATEAADASTVTLPDGPAVALVPGQAPRLNDAARACGLVIAPLFEHDADLEALGRAVPAEHGFFEALNAAAFNTAVSIRAPRNLQLDAPLRLVIPALAGRDVLPRVLIVAESGAQFTVVEDHTGGDATSVVVGVTEIVAAANAEVRHVLVQRWAEGVVGHLTQRAVVERDARFLGASAGLGGAVAKLDLGGVLAGPGARSELVGVSLPEKRQHHDHHTVHQHTSGHTSSNIDFKVAVTDRARSAYTGLIRIEEDAAASEAFQENRNLLLSERARADTIPELEILTDDVSCSHGATAAPVDPEQIFYLQSRGISAGSALRLVVQGFVETTLQLMPDNLRGELEDLLEDRLKRIEESA
jgi:Fe-S cluster assembly protein SufD